jgi:transcriptional regulator NrdR family protein
MNCLSCHARTDVYDTRVLPDMGVRRKRKCVACGFRFATLEVLDAMRPLRTREPKPVKTPKPKVSRSPKAVAAKPARRENNFDDDADLSHGVSEDLWEVARELGIEGYR